MAQQQHPKQTAFVGVSFSLFGSTQLSSAQLYDHHRQIENSNGLFFSILWRRNIWQTRDSGAM